MMFKEVTKQWLSDYQQKILLRIQGDQKGKESLILMSPKLDFACNIYKILKEEKKKKSDMDMNSVPGFSCPWKQLP